MYDIAVDDESNDDGTGDDSLISRTYLHLSGHLSLVFEFDIAVSPHRQPH